MQDEAPYQVNRIFGARTSWGVIVTFAKDGSGDFKTISEAFAAIPKTYTGRYMVFVKEGVYNEQVAVTKKMQNVTIGRRRWIFGTSNGIRNTAGPDGHQAVAARVQADQGYQDTLYTQAHRQFYRSCIIAGTIDLILGEAAVVFQNCIMIDRKPMENQGNMVTAQR
ncbi:putative pectinesterase/pectinesterase inhibitor [Trifolium repens]|nr:putative pectinesterase/pectinesterase inhibitor [Trifolium repens]